MLTKVGIEKYFNAEKQESLLFIVIGVVAILVAFALFFIYKSSFFKGLAIPLIGIAIIQISVGYTVYARSDKQRIDMVYAHDMDQARMKRDEVPRMEVVMKNFVIYRYVEIALIIAGLALFFYCKTRAYMLFWEGLGIGLALQSFAMLIADFFAEKRGLEYLYGLRELLK